MLWFNAVAMMAVDGSHIPFTRVREAVLSCDVALGKKKYLKETIISARIRTWNTSCPIAWSSLYVYVQ
jgi:hypothetical protein